MCNCLKILADEYSKDFHGFYFSNVSNLMSMETGESRTVWPVLRFKYMRKEDGSVGKKEYSSFISPNYCPMCGLHYKTGKPGRKIKEK